MRLEFTPKFTAQYQLNIPVLFFFF